MIMIHQFCPLVVTPSNIQPKLAWVQSWVYTKDDKGDSDNNGPQFDIQDVDVEAGIDGTDDGGVEEGKQQVAAQAVVLPDGLGLVDAAKHAGDPPHQKADEVLDQQDDAGGDAQVAVDAMKVAAGSLSELVGLDDDDAGGEEEEGEEVEDGVEAGARDLFVGGPGGLEDQDGLGEEEDTGGLEERVWTEEGDKGWVVEDGGPDKSDEEEGAELGEPAGT